MRIKLPSAVVSERPKMRIFCQCDMCGAFDVEVKKMFGSPGFKDPKRARFHICGECVEIAHGLLQAEQGGAA